MAYKVVGGVYKDFAMKEVVVPETHGPFTTYEEAHKAWQASIWQNVDNALHKLTIIEVDINGNPVILE